MSWHFVLVHGSCHGAWCWYKVVAMLKSMGHKVTALDLAASGIDFTKQAHEIRCITDYTEPLMKFMAALPAEERVIVVGHSMGGISTTMVMEKFPNKIAAAVFVAAYMPGPNLPYLYITQQITPRSDDFFLDTQYTYDSGPENPPTSMLLGPKYAAARVYQRSPPEDLILASVLMRFAPLFNDPESLEGSSLTEENYGTVRRVYMVCTEDIGMSEAMQRWMIEKNPPDDVKVIHGADHMAMFSKTSELCSYLIEVANKYE